MSLIVNSLSKRYGNKWAVRDVSFEVEGGSIIGLFGPTASGKSTLLHILSGAHTPTSGSVVIDGSETASIKQKDRPVTYIGETNGGIISTFLKAFGKESGSSGEMERLQFAKAVEDPKRILLLDDPFRKMDRSLRAECVRHLKRLGKMKGKVVIFASSDFEQILEIADEVAYISAGYIIQNGSPQDLYDLPATKELAELTGENNLITARRITSTDATVPEFHSIEGGHRIFADNTAKKDLGAINQNVTLAIRPEQVVMSMGASFPEDNLLKGVVKKIERRGSTSMIVFDAAGLILKTRVFKVVGLNVGDECMLGLPPHRLQILKD